MKELFYAQERIKDIEYIGNMVYFNHDWEGVNRSFMPGYYDIYACVNYYNVCVKYYKMTIGNGIYLYYGKEVEIDLGKIRQMKPDRIIYWDTPVCKM